MVAADAAALLEILCGSGLQESDTAPDRIRQIDFFRGGGDDGCLGRLGPFGAQQLHDFGLIEFGGPIAGTLVGGALDLGVGAGLEEDAEGGEIGFVGGGGEDEGGHAEGYGEKSEQ